MEDGEAAVWIFVHTHGGFDIVATVAIGRDLQDVAVVDDAIVGAHGTLFLQA